MALSVRFLLSSIGYTKMSGWYIFHHIQVDLFYNKSEVMGLKIAICDDEANVRCLLKHMILEREPDAAISEFEDGSQLEHADVFQYDILFLDVSMSEQSGVETAQRIRQKQKENNEGIWGSFPLIIFVTGYAEYMPDAFSCNAFGYLVKPPQKAEFDACLSKAVAECVKRHAQKEPQYIFLKIGTASQKILIDDIEYVESQKRKKVIHLSGGGKAGRLVWYGSMEELEQTLADGFFRIHKGYLINMRYVRKYDRIQVWMQGGDCLLLSKYRYADFVNSYLEFLNQQNGSDKSI